MKYDVLIIGGGPGGIFAAYELVQKWPTAKIAMLEAGRALSLTTVVGLPLNAGGKLYNCAAVVMGGQLLGVVPKTNLPNYGEFYEGRWFTPAPAAVGVIPLLGQQVPFGADLLFCCREVPENERLPARPDPLLAEEYLPGVSGPMPVSAHLLCLCL